VVYSAPSCPPEMKRQEPTCVDGCDRRRCTVSGLKWVQAAVSMRAFLLEDKDDGGAGDGSARIEVGTPNVLEALAAVTASDDGHDVLRQIGGVVATQGQPLASRDGDLLPAHPVEGATDVECPDIVQRLRPVPAAEDPDLVLVRHSPARERRARPALRGDVEDECTVLVRGTLAAADYDDLAADERRGVRATRRR